MKRKSLGLFLMFLIVSMFTIAQTSPNYLIKGKVSCEGIGIAGVQVTDGTQIVETDKKGNYLLQTANNSELVYYSLPSGYESPIRNGVPVFYAPISANAKVQKVDFELIKAKKSQQKHTLIAWADPQVLEIEEFALMDKVLDDINQTIAATASDVPVYAISLGDNVFDKMDFFDDYKKAISKVKVPFYHVIGNHDMDYNNRSNELSAKSYSAAFGPTHFSYNIGNVHYVVLKDVFYYGYSYRYMGYITENQLAWLEKDLQKVKKGSTVIVSLHIPTVFNESKEAEYATVLSNSVMNNAALFKILSPFRSHILAGHSHTQWNTIVSPTIIEHVHAAASAAWWQGEIGLDGTPKGYTVYEIDGDSLSWYFKGVGMSKSEQFKAYSIGADARYTDCFIANVFNYDPTWKVEWLENDVLKGEMTQYWGYDPLANKQYQPGKNKKFDWLSAGETHHLFKAKPENAGAKITIRVTDRFKNVYIKQL